MGKLEKKLTTLRADLSLANYRDRKLESIVTPDAKAIARLATFVKNHSFRSCRSTAKNWELRQCLGNAEGRARKRRDLSGTLEKVHDEALAPA